MSIVQKNVFGNNIVYEFNTMLSRELSHEIKLKILNILKEFTSRGVTIRYEHSGETQEFSDLLRNFLQDNGYQVTLISVTMSEIKRKEFSIEKHPTVHDWAIMKIGTLN